MNVGHGWGYLSMAAKNSIILIFRTMAPCIRVSLKGRINLERSYLSLLFQQLNLPIEKPCGGGPSRRAGRVGGSGGSSRSSGEDVGEGGTANSPPAPRSKAAKPPRSASDIELQQHQYTRLVWQGWKSYLSWHGALHGPLTCLVRCFRNYKDTRTPSSPSRRGGPRTHSQEQLTHKIKPTHLLENTARRNFLVHTEATFSSVLLWQKTLLAN